MTDRTRHVSNPVIIRELETSSDGAHILLCGNDQSIRVMDASGVLQRSVKGVQHPRDAAPLPATCASWAPSGQRFVAGYGDGTLGIWNLANLDQPEQVFWERHTDMVTRIRWSPDETAIASVGEDGVLGIWDATTGLARFHYDGPSYAGHHEADPCDLTWAPDGRRIAVACADRTVHLLDAATGKTLEVNVCYEVIECLVWEPAGPSVLVLLQSHTVSLWHPDENYIQYLFTLSKPPRAAAWSPDQTHIAIATEYEVMIWSVTALLEDQLRPEKVVPADNIQTVCWAPGKVPVFSTGANGVFVLHLES